MKDYVYSLNINFNLLLLPMYFNIMQEIIGTFLMTLLRKQWALKEICGTHLVFRSLNMKCLNMDFFHYILF